MKKNTIKVVGTMAAILLFATGCGKVPKLENGQEHIRWSTCYQKAKY